MVVHLAQMFAEIEHNVQLDVEAGTTAMDGWERRLRISDRAHLVFDLHQKLDGLLEAEKKGGKIGTTGRGIGPVYTSKAARHGLRVVDLVDSWSTFEDGFRKMAKGAKQRHPSLEIDVEADLAEMKRLRDRVAPLVHDSLTHVHDALEAGERVLVEGANACLLDIDFGSYPFVTSSATTVGGVCTGLGVPPPYIKKIYGVCKAYTTRVGSGGFPTELTCEIGQKLQSIGHEFGVTTGRPRRCGWLDLVMMRHSCRVNGYTSLMITKLDCLDTFETIRVGVAYTIKGKREITFPANFRACDDLEVEYINLPGWNTATTECTTAEQLPANAWAYIRFIEQYLGVPVQWVGVGPAREATIRLF